MPCYDPPPPWKKDQSANEAEAVKILCEQCRDMCNAGTLAQAPLRIIEWFLAHRMIDVSIAVDYGRADEFHAACQDVAKIEAVIVALEGANPPKPLSPFTIVKCVAKASPEEAPYDAWEIPELSDLEIVSGMSDKIPHWATDTLGLIHSSEVNVGPRSVGSRIKGNWIIRTKKDLGAQKHGTQAYYNAAKFKKIFTIVG